MNENPAYKSGFATLIGRPNVGKSTLMNRLIGQKIAITSNKPQTTRNRIQTVLTLDEGQIVFLDTPGIHKAKNKLGIIVDTGAGISDSVLEFLVASGEVLLVTTPEPTSITDSYSLLKALYRHPRFQEDFTKVMMVANRVSNIKEGQVLFDKLNAVVTRYLKIPMTYMGCVPQDPQVMQAVMQQVPVSIQNPGAKASQAYQRIAESMCEKEDDTAQEQQPRRGMAAFFSHIIGTRNRATKQSR